MSLVALGKVTGAHGLRGTLKIHCFGNDAANLLQATHVFVGRQEVQEAGDEAKRYDVVDAVDAGSANTVRLKLEGVSDRNAAELLRGTYVFAERQELQKLGPGEYYWHELLGCHVEDERGTELGVVESLLETGAHAVLVVQAHAAQSTRRDAKKEGKQYLIPAVPEFLRKVNVEQRRIVVHVIPGLLDLDAK